MGVSAVVGKTRLVYSSSFTAKFIMIPNVLDGAWVVMCRNVWGGANGLAFPEREREICE